MSISKNYLIIIISVLLVSSLFAQKKKGRAAPKEAVVPNEISYSVLNYRNEKVVRANQIGLAYKKSLAGKKLPVVVFIHGGGWEKGDKDQMSYFAINYAKAGFVGITVSYRLLSEAKYPAQAQDVKEAIRFIKTLAGKYPIDVNRIGVAGYSAGAHLALLIALSEGEELYETNKYNQFDSLVQCAVGISAPIDLGKNKLKKIKFLDSEQNENKELRRKASPINYIHKKQVPILLFHGDKDSLVPSFHYRNFLEKAEALGINNVQTYISGEGGHMFFFLKKLRK